MIKLLNVICYLLNIKNILFKPASIIWVSVGLWWKLNISIFFEEKIDHLSVRLLLRE